MTEPVWTARDLVVLAVVAGAYDDGRTFRNLDEVSRALGMDRAATGRSAKVLHGDGLLRGTEAASIEGSDADYDLLTPEPTGAGYRELEEWPPAGGVDRLQDFAEQRAAAAATAEERGRWEQFRDLVARAARAGAGGINLAAAAKTLLN